MNLVEGSDRRDDLVHPSSKSDASSLPRNPARWSSDGTFYFTVPASIRFFEILSSQELRSCDDAARYFVDLVLRKSHSSKDGFARLLAKHLDEIMSGRDRKKIVEALRYAGVVERNSYAPGERPYGYRLKDQYRDQDTLRVAATDSLIIKRLRKHLESREKANRITWRPVHHNLWSRQFSLAIDGNAARHEIDLLELANSDVSLCHQQNRQIQLANIERLELRQHVMSVGRFGRVFNSITSLPRAIRRHLTDGTQHLTCIDIANSQPAFLATLLSTSTHTGSRAPHPSTPTPIYDLQMEPPISTTESRVALMKFTQWCERGELYEKLARHMNWSRSWTKRRFFVDILANKGNYPSELGTFLKREFSAVSEFVQSMNASDHRNVIRSLQQAESNFVIDGWAELYMRRYPHDVILTLHDAIYLPENRVAAGVETFEECIKASGYNMAFKIDDGSVEGCIAPADAPGVLCPA